MSVEQEREKMIAAEMTAARKELAAHFHFAMSEKLADTVRAVIQEADPHVSLRDLFPGFARRQMEEGENSIYGKLERAGKPLSRAEKQVITSVIMPQVRVMERMGLEPTVGILQILSADQLRVLDNRFGEPKVNDAQRAFARLLVGYNPPDH